MRLIRGHPVRSILLGLLLVVVVAFAWSAIVVWGAAHHDDAADVDRADAIVVLGAAQYNGRPSPVFRGRLDHAVLLWGQDKSDLVITVGANQPGDRTTEAEAGRKYLAAQGVPDDAIVALPIGHTTLESLEAVARELRRRELDSAFLVSDPWHNARIEAMADDLGFDGHASATWTSAATSEQTRGAGYLRETLAYLEYRLLGR
jgi:vancomycin permeability regulator SanA